MSMADTTQFLDTPEEIERMLAEIKEADEHYHPEAVIVYVLGAMAITVICAAAVWFFG